MSEDFSVCPACGALPCDWTESEPGRQIITRVAEAAEAIAAQAGVGGMETAGSIISYLAAHPEQIDGFFSGEASILDWPVGWHEHGLLSWHGQDGKIYDPKKVRSHRFIKRMEKGSSL